MAYCDQDDLLKMIPEDQLKRLTDDEGVGEINADRIAEAIESGAEEIDTYIGGRVKLPINENIPPILSKYNVDIAIYNLYSRVKEDIPETRAQRYKNAVRFLEKVSEGKITLGLQPPPSPPGENDYAGKNLVYAREKIFSEEELGKY